jgi:PAS domain S-box-containing protein
MPELPDRLRPEDAQAVFEAAPDGILIVNAEGKIAAANPEAFRLFGYAPGELVGQAVEVLVPAALRGAHRQHREGYVGNPHPRPMGIGLELAGVRRDGVRIPIEISLSPLRSLGGDMVIAVVRDLTERKRLKTFGVAALKAAEEERRRIARELHDETAQELAAVLMNLTLLEKRLGEDPVANDVAALTARVAEVVEGVRRIARGLRPPELQDVGLAAALRSFVRERFEPGRVEIELDGSEARLSPEQALVAYRIAQEALTNAGRHARAARIRLAMREGADHFEVVLEVEDDGVGFDLDETARSGGGLGLMGMEERSQIAGGRLEIETHPGAGTKVQLCIPVRGDRSLLESGGFDGV